MKGAVLAALLVAGCSAPSAPGQPQAPGLADHPMVWSGCAGAFAVVGGPASLYPSSAPQGWELDGAARTSVQVRLLRCERVSWGPFERGPVLIAQEWRDDFAAPDRCLEGLHEEHFLLESIWFSDPEVARHAKGLGLPAGAASFSVQETPLGPFTRQEWSWGPAGVPASSLTVLEGPLSQYGSQHFVRRLFWADGDGVGVLDLRHNSTYDPTDSTGAWGFLRPPTLYGRANPSPAFATQTGYPLLGVEAAGELHRFEDTGCEQPR